MNRFRQRRRRTRRQWLGLCLVLLLAVAPALNLAGVDLALQARDQHGAHQAHPQHGHSGHHNSGEHQSKLAHHTSSNACLQCLALGGMSLAGAAMVREPAPTLHVLGAAWAMASLAWDSRGAKIIVCRGPPMLA